MRQLSIGFVLVLLTMSPGIVVQSGTPKQSEPPVAALIDISEPDENGVVTIIGGAGSVFPTAQVAIRNMYTKQTVITRAGVTGRFTAQIDGSGATPFWISPVASLPNNVVTDDMALPGGPGTIVYGPAAMPSPSYEITPLLLDGVADDWPAAARLSDKIYALTNQDSLYIAISRPTEEGQSLVVVFTGEGNTYNLSLQPALPQSVIIRQIAPKELDPQVVVSGVASGELIELRIALDEVTDVREGLTLNRIEVHDEEDIVDSFTLDAVIPFRKAEQDGIVYAGEQLESFRRFTISGSLAQGAAFWSGDGRIDALEQDVGGILRLELNVMLDVPDLAQSLSGLDFIGLLGLQPVTLGEQQIAGLHTNNGWSNILTPGGLAIDNLRGDVELGVVRVPAAQVIRRGDLLLVGFRFEVSLPSELPDGIYVPTFRGQAQIGDGEIIHWEDSGLFGSGYGAGRDAPVRLPLVLKIGEMTNPRMLWTLFYDTFSDGARGVLPQEDKDKVALSNRVRFNSDRYILPPGAYPIEPYLLNMLSNAYDVTVPPLLPLLIPGGRLNAVITRPDGDVDELPDVAIIQNQLSTAALDERSRSGGQSPMNAYRLTTGDRMYSDYMFDAYGEYTIELNGFVEDIFGNRYEGGGTYQVFIAEPLDITPGVLSGTPFMQGDMFFIGGHIAPGFPASIKVHVKIYDMKTSELNAKIFDNLEANNRGYFAADGVMFDIPGEYIIDYEALYEDTNGRLWAGSLRSAGVIGNLDSSLVMHGSRGVDVYTSQFPSEYRPAHFDTQQYPPNDLTEVDPILNFPYFAGDVAVIEDTLSSGIQPVLTIQDLAGGYRTWLNETVPDYVANTGLSLNDLSLVSELPIFPAIAGGDAPFGVALRPNFTLGQGYSYFSAVRPDVMVRQFVLGQNDDGLLLYWDADDPLNQQIGAGVGGLRPGDYVFLFGGAVIKIPELGQPAVIPYASSALILEEDAAVGVFPAGHPSTMLEVRGKTLGSLFYLTGFTPGQIFSPGDRLNLVGQVAPAVQTDIFLRLVAPNSDEQIIHGSTNRFGYFYMPDAEIDLDQSGIWTIELMTMPAINSDEVIVGGVPGAIDYQSEIYVVPMGNNPLEWSLKDDLDDEFDPGIPFNIGLNIPDKWTQIEAHYTVRTASYVLEDGVLNRSGNTVLYQFNPGRIAAEIPNFEIDGRGEGMSGSDVVYLTFIITGRDEGGRTDIRARTLTLFHDRIISFDTLRGVDLE